MNDPIEIPSLEQIEEMERQRSQAIQSLEISNGSVKCQRCRNDIPIVGKLSSRPNQISSSVLYYCHILKPAGFNDYTR